MKRLYETPVLLPILWEAEDVLTLSGCEVGNADRLDISEYVFSGGRI